MEDSHFYKLKGIEGELEYYTKLFKDGGFSREIPSEYKRKAVRNMLNNIRRHTETIQQYVGQEFTPEF